eukprot:scaffold213_cov245-Pinguiococcus_pyrenoidosus.AAC.53
MGLWRIPLIRCAASDHQQRTTPKTSARARGERCSYGTCSLTVVSYACFRSISSDDSFERLIWLRGHQEGGRVLELRQFQGTKWATGARRSKENRSKAIVWPEQRSKSVVLFPSLTYYKKTRRKG